MIVHNMLIRRGLPVTLVMAATIVMQPAPVSAGGGYFSMSVGVHYPYYGRHHGHHFRVHRPWPYGPHYPHRYVYTPWVGTQVAVPTPAAWRGGAIDFGIKPKRTRVWVDGAYVGKSGKFDGYPGYLWLDAGRHKLTFYAEGYRTFEQVIEVRPGLVTEVRFDMVPLPPGEEPTPPPGGEPVSPPVVGPEPPAAAGREPPEAPAPPQSTAPILDLRGDGGTVRLIVEPAEASIYLDGRFLGTASQVRRLHAGLLVDAGAHVLEVVHPRYLSERLDFRVSAGEELEVTVDLERAAETS